MWCHRDELIKYLDHIQGQSDRGLEHLKQHQPMIKKGRIQVRKDVYSRLKDVLLEADERATKTAFTLYVRLLG